jgi:hypothetical protein
MYSQAILFSVLVALTEARFAQEQVPIAAISASSGGNSGDAATLAGSAISTLLAAANPCDKVCFICPSIEISLTMPTAYKGR